MAWTHDRLGFGTPAAGLFGAEVLVLQVRVRGATEEEGAGRTRPG